jgi:cytochrome c biogenesis protein CcdA
MFETFGLWAKNLLETRTISPGSLAAALLLGIVGSSGCACNFAMLAAVAGIAGAAGGAGRRLLIAASVAFILGTVFSLSIVGALTGFVSGTVGMLFGAWWKVAAGLVAVFFGLVSLDLAPFRLRIHFLSGMAASNIAGLKQKEMDVGTLRKGMAAAFVYGFSIGGATASCSSLCCNPTLPAMLGFATLGGGSLKGAMLLAFYSLGYSLPVAIGLFGLGLGINWITRAINWIAPALRFATGIVLVGAGFFLLYTA